MPGRGKKREPASRSSAMTHEKQSLIRQIDAVKRALAAKKASKLATKGGTDDPEYRTKKD
jgi:hypothetical protein